jgi:hypothetical protein
MSLYPALGMPRPVEKKTCHNTSLHPVRDASLTGCTIITRGWLPGDAILTDCRVPGVETRRATSSLRVRLLDKKKGCPANRTAEISGFFFARR